MLFKSILALGCLAGSAFAQNIRIAAPPEWSTVIAGQNITVEIDKPV